MSQKRETQNTKPIAPFIQHIFSSLAPSANHLKINQRILSSQKSKEINVNSSQGRSHT